MYLFIVDVDAGGVAAADEAAGGVAAVGVAAVDVVSGIDVTFLTCGIFVSICLFP